MNAARGIFFLVIALVAGLIGYQVGISQAVAVQVPAGTPMMYGYPWHFGFGVFGFIFPLLFLFLIFGFFRAMFWGWSGGRGYGGHMWAGRRERLEELHRELHGEKPAQGSDATRT